MSKIIRLTEKDLTKLINRIISEQPKHGTGVIMNEPEKKELANQNTLRPVLEKLGYNQIKSLDGGWKKMISQKNKTLTVHFENEYVVVDTKNIKQPTQTDSNGKIHGMGLSSGNKKFPLKMRPNIMSEFGRFLKDCENKF